MSSQRLSILFAAAATALGLGSGAAEAATQVLFVNGFLLVVGDDGNNQVAVRCGPGGNVLVNDAKPASIGTLPCSQVTGIVLLGGDGDDTLDIFHQAGQFSSLFADGVVAFGNQGSDRISGAVIASGGDLPDTIIGTGVHPGEIGPPSHVSILSGGVGDDTIEVPPDAGATFVIGGGSADNVIGGNGDDVIIVGTNSNIDRSFVRGRGGNDVIIEQGVANDSLLKGGLGDDVLISGSGDTLVGGAGNDTLLGGTFNETLLGKDGDDILIGGPGDDTLDGGAGDNLEVQ